MEGGRVSEEGEGFLPQRREGCFHWSCGQEKASQPTSQLLGRTVLFLFNSYLIYFLRLPAFPGCPLTKWKKISRYGTYLRSVAMGTRERNWMGVATCQLYLSGHSISEVKKETERGFSNSCTIYPCNLPSLQSISQL